MAITPCTDTSLGVSFITNRTSVAALDFELVHNNVPIGGNLVASTQWDGGGTLLAGFVARIWLATGPGPVFTKQVVLAQFTETQPLGVPVSGSWPATALVPNVGRVWSPTTDAFVATINANYTVSGLLNFRWQVCNNGAAVDCCAETLQKLDQILAFVGKVYRNAP